MNHFSRRSFVKAAAASLGFPTIVPASVFGANAPSKQITVGSHGFEANQLRETRPMRKPWSLA